MSRHTLLLLISLGLVAGCDIFPTPADDDDDDSIGDDDDDSVGDDDDDDTAGDDDDDDDTEGLEEFHGIVRARFGEDLVAVRDARVLAVTGEEVVEALTDLWGAYSFPPGVVLGEETELRVILAGEEAPELPCGDAVEEGLGRGACLLEENEAIHLVSAVNADGGPCVHRFGPPFSLPAVDTTLSIAGASARSNGQGQAVLWLAGDLEVDVVAVCGASVGERSGSLDDPEATRVVLDNHDPVIHGVDQAGSWGRAVPPGAALELVALTEDPDDDPLILQWAYQGELVGEGPELVLELGEEPGQHTVHLLVADERGGVALSSTSFDVVESPRLVARVETDDGLPAPEPLLYLGEGEGLLVDGAVVLEGEAIGWEADQRHLLRVEAEGYMPWFEVAYGPGEGLTLPLHRTTSITVTAGEELAIPITDEEGVETGAELVVGPFSFTDVMGRPMEGSAVIEWRYLGGTAGFPGERRLVTGSADEDDRVLGNEGLYLAVDLSGLSGAAPADVPRLSIAWPDTEDLEGDLFIEALDAEVGRYQLAPIGPAGGGGGGGGVWAFPNDNWFLNRGATKVGGTWRFPPRPPDPPPPLRACIGVEIDNPFVDSSWVVETRYQSGGLIERKHLTRHRQWVVGPLDEGDDVTLTLHDDQNRVRDLVRLDDIENAWIWPTAVVGNCRTRVRMPGPPPSGTFLTRKYVDPAQLPSQFGPADMVELYYDAIDPLGDRTTFEDWMATLDWPKYDGGGAFTPRLDTGDDAFMVYGNDADLGFGREMHARVWEDWDPAVSGEEPIVAMYTTNYSDVHQAALGTGVVVTVAMEYSPHPVNGGPHYTKFYAFAPNGARVGMLDLDGNGPKAMPDLCTNCHGGAPMAESQVQVNGAGVPTAPYANDGRMAAGQQRPRFIPFPVDSFGYDPAFPLDAHGELQMRAMNEAVLMTDVVAETREMIHAWYGSTPANPATATALVSPTSTQDTSYVPPGWSGDSNMYTYAVKPFCHVCHMSVNAPGFWSEAEWNNWSGAIRGDVCSSPTSMPHARVTQGHISADSRAVYYFESRLYPGGGQCSAYR